MLYVPGRRKHRPALSRPLAKRAEMKALLLIAHGSRKAEANADLAFVADRLRDRGRYPIVRVAYLELAEPTIADGGAACAAGGATEVILLPYFLSAGVHVRDDL